MVGNVTSLTNNGLRDWLIQRVSAVVLALYFLFLLGFLLWTPTLDYQTLHGLFHHTAMRITTVIVLLSLITHSWIGLWTVTTDYLKGTIGRLTTQMVILLGLLALFIWGFEILWGAV